jgi:RimJ/RimL family protein N-acetyltransferase
MKQFGPLETERLVMRRYTSGDGDLFYQLVSDPKVMRYYPGVYDRERTNAGLQRILASYENLGYSVLAVEQRADKQFVGNVGLLHWDDVDGREDVEVAYMLRPQFWGLGYATEAARASRDWAFEHLGVDRVVSYIAVENAPSIAVAERNGMHFVHRVDDSRVGFPISVYEIERAEWTARSPGA